MAIQGVAARSVDRSLERTRPDVTGVVFAVVLITVPLGYFIGFAKTTSNFRERSGAGMRQGSGNDFSHGVERRQAR